MSFLCSSTIIECGTQIRIFPSNGGPKLDSFLKIRLTSGNFEEPLAIWSSGHHHNGDAGGQGINPCLPQFGHNMWFVLKNPGGCAVHPSGPVVVQSPPGYPWTYLGPPPPP